MSEDHRSRIAALGKALAVLEAFGPAAPDLRIAEIAALTGMNRSSAQRITHTLVRCGYLHRDEVSSALSLTYRSACIAHTFLSTNHLIDLAVPALVDLSARTNLRADLWVMQGADIVNIARVPSAAHSRTMAPIGERLPTLTSAPGRAMLSTLSGKALAQRIAELAEAPDRAITPDEQAAHECTLADAAARGYVFEAGSNVHDEGTIGAAVFGADGACLAAVSVSGWLGEVNEEDVISQVVQPVLATARALSSLRIQTWSRAVSRPAEGKDALPAPEEDEDDPLFISSVARGFQVLEAFTPANSVPTLTALHRLTGLPVATVQRIVDTLMECGYVEKDARHKTFRLTVKTLDMLFNFQMSNRVIKTIWPRLVQLRDDCGQRCSFCILAGADIVHLLHVQSYPHADFHTVYVGRRLPALSTSGGRAILSTLDNDRLQAVLAQSAPKPLTPFTITDKSELQQIIVDAREKGYAFTDQQSVMFDLNVATPIVDSDGHVLGAMVVSGSKRDWTVERMEEEIVPRLVAYARSMFA
ncbi:MULTISPECIES: IclR family transcriptional regulator [Burkholderia]|uniref:IclR family regulatory protein n=1 Tax=Burkholderia aenigmatica TaxID=2015348 RepID=A0A6J5IU66_9BURK|nr:MULTISPECIES: helix-turn-helix domain-containing protein [Burkholderia]UKD16786.1 helix-turn-helix domain-containing protein [Burkholderia aenigmatica]CAB3962189.1 IclR family regulatory protein [Burkholderia aenigmatica]